MSGIPTKSDDRLRNNFDAPELAATTLPSRSTRSNGSGNLQMIREKSRCVIFAHTYLLMSQTCQTASRIPLLCRFLLAWLRLHDDPATPVGWQLLLALFRGRLSDDITVHHASWRASDDRVVTFLFSLSTPIKSGIVSVSTTSYSSHQLAR